MIHVIFKTLGCKEGLLCDGCTDEIEYNQIYSSIELDATGTVLNLCTECADNLQHDIFEFISNL